MTDKLLAEWFWIDRWMGSRAFLLPIDARGLYREMLTQAWRRDARLPNDHEAIRRAVGVTLKEWRRCWPLIERFWRVEGAHLVNDTQLEIYAETLARTERASTKGRKGAVARWRKSTQAPARGHAQPDAQASSQAPPEEWPLSLSLEKKELRAAPSARSALARTPNGNGNYRVIERIAFELLAQGFWQPADVKLRVDSEADLVEAVKHVCAQRWIDTGCHPDVLKDTVHRACASEWAKHEQGLRRRKAVGV